MRPCCRLREKGLFRVVAQLRQYSALGGRYYLGVAAEKIGPIRARITGLDRRDPARKQPLEVAGAGSASV